MDIASSPSKTWTVVKFKEDCTVSAVPTTWITENGECLWPPFTADKIASAIKNHLTNTCWPTFKIDIFRNATYDNYDTARRKSKRAEDTSDLNTEDEYPKRRRIIKKFNSSSSSEESGGLDILRTPPKIDRKRDSAKSRSRIIPAVPKVASLSSINLINSPVMTENLSENVSPITPARNEGKENCTCTCCPQHKHADEYLKQILNQQNFIKSILNDLLVEIRSTKNNNHNEAILDRNNSIFQKLNLPVQNEDDFKLLNDYLKNEDNFTKTITEMCKIGGNNNYEFVKRCMATLISNEFAMQYSWLGRRTKKSFCNFEVAKLIIDAADMAKMSINIQETETSLKNWLRRARDRTK